MAAAAKKRDHHAERLAWWEQKQKEVMDELKEKGLEVTESLAMQYSDSKAFTASASLRGGARVMVKDTYQQQLDECHTKIHQHSTQKKEYDGWVQLFTANPDALVALDINDFLYFFAK